MTDPTPQEKRIARIVIPDGYRDAEEYAKDCELELAEPNQPATMRSKYEWADMLTKGMNGLSPSDFVHDIQQDAIQSNTQFIRDQALEAAAMLALRIYEDQDNFTSLDRHTALTLAVNFRAMKGKPTS